MDYPTAYRFLTQQGQADPQDGEALLVRLSRGQPPIPGQITTVLLALKVVYEGLRGAPTLERDLANALYTLARDSRHWFEQGHRQGVDWPPLLGDDLRRISEAVGYIFADRWENIKAPL
ncbi:hypothetical protein [Prochlorothrix hollandica]|uniref:Dethiobiotin synthetase n=1 Tax=Prochlorothrix hollandica PCC 9006 = CALU 1027 TaxID=317619 RepID=A0A0M2PWL7_PROHO|nr:hypothetical protein [Prochlorothrix hollandica]KKJ00806.1 Dethiobiotin synthetase [Prochlorothrix hollandica PCC 9006 = CALU 1027]